MQLPLQAVYVSKFTCNRTRKMFVAEHSDLRGVSLRQPLYDDAADAGFAIYNPATQQLSRWAFAREIRDERENELQVTVYVPCSESVRKHPMLQGWEVHVLND